MSDENAQPKGSGEPINVVAVPIFSAEEAVALYGAVTERGDILTHMAEPSSGYSLADIIMRLRMHMDDLLQDPYTYCGFGDDKEAAYPHSLAIIRRITALGLIAMEIHGTGDWRSHEDDPDGELLNEKFGALLDELKQTMGEDLASKISDLFSKSVDEFRDNDSK